MLQAISDSLRGYAPRLWAYEVHNSILMGPRRGRISKADAEGFLASWADLNIHLTDPVSYDAIFKLAELSGLTVYDAAMSAKNSRLMHSLQIFSGGPVHEDRIIAGANRIAPDHAPRHIGESFAQLH